MKKRHTLEFSSFLSEFGCTINTIFAFVCVYWTKHAFTNWTRPFKIVILYV